MTTLHHRPTHRQRRSNSTFSSSSEADDMITPCPLEKQEAAEAEVEHREEATTSRRQHQQQQSPPTTITASKQDPPKRPRSWLLDTDAAALEADEDPAALWRSMLAIQRAFGCYNSARMRAAVEMDEEEEGEHVPSRTCLDLLNDGIRQLPEEERRQLDEFLMSSNHQHHHH